MKRITEKIAAALLIAACIMSAMCSCGTEKEPERKSRLYYEYFDTVTVLYDFSGGSDADFDKNAAAFESELALCNKLFDIYNDYDGINNLKTVNDAHGAPVAVDERIIALLELSRQMYSATDGRVNIAMGSVLKIWHGCREGGVSLPSDAELEAAAEHCSIENVIIDPVAGTVALADPLMSLDVGAIAKGFAIDRAAEVLRARGASSYVIDVGGNLYAIGARADGTPYNTGVANPDGGECPAYLSVSDGGVATSGDYERYYTVDGKRYHHIIDSETLYPSDYYRSVTVYSDSAAISDALSTALFNTADIGEARNILSRVGGVREVIFIRKDGEVVRISV